MFKRILIVGMALLLLLSTLLTGCGAKAPETDPAQNQSSAPPPAENKEPSLVFIPGDMANESQAYSAKMFQQYGADFGFKVSIFDGRGDAQVQAQAVATAVAQGAKAILINPNDIKGIVPSLKQAKEAGVIVGLFSSDLDQENQQYRDFFVGVNDNDAGKVAAEAFIKQFPDGAKIVEVCGQAGHDAQIKRKDGFLEGIKGSKITIIDSQAPSLWSTAEAMAITEDFIVKYGNEIQGVFCHWDNGAKGVIEATKAAGMKNIFIVAVDGCRAGFDQVRAGEQGATIMQNFTSQAKKSLEVAGKALKGESYDKLNFVPLDIITLDNIDNFETPEW